MVWPTASGLSSLWTELKFFFSDKQRQAPHLPEAGLGSGRSTTVTQRRDPCVRRAEAWPVRGEGRGVTRACGGQRRDLCARRAGLPFCARVTGTQSGADGAQFTTRPSPARLPLERHPDKPASYLQRHKWGCSLDKTWSSSSHRNTSSCPSLRLHREDTHW